MGKVIRNVTFFAILALVAGAAFVWLAGDLALGSKLAHLAGSAYTLISPSDCPQDSAQTPSPGISHPIAMQESSSLLGERMVTKTFGLAVTDITGDGRDDILIGGHEMNPHLYINSGSGFTNASAALFPTSLNRDRHGYTFADLDNDGDLDLAIAGGGDDGVGRGAPNMFLKNDSQQGVIRFTRQAVSKAMSVPPSRTRALIPVASSDGTAVDLYLATLAREGYPSQLFRNARAQGTFEFKPEEDFLTLTINDHGRGVVADYDGDGNNDYLVVQDSTLKLYWHPNSGREASVLSHGAYSASVGDFNNDGGLDIFMGRLSAPSRSDNLAHNRNAMNFVLQNNGPGDSSSIAFKSQSPRLNFDLDQYLPATQARPLAGSLDIFLGRGRDNPEARIFALDKEMAEGEPASFDQSGIYIWYAPASAEWNMKWVFYDELNQFKGSVRGAGISDVRKAGFTSNEPFLARDVIFINQGDGSFSELCAALPQHHGATSDSTVADFNNDGWLDIIGLHQQEQGLANGEIFVLTNNAGLSFTPGDIAVRERDKLQRADLIVHGFFNDDEKPDIVMTQGFGQIPGNQGAPRLMLNNSANDYPALLINLEGTSANKFAIGAELTVTNAKGAIVGYRVQGLNTNIHQNTHWMHFGLGAHAAPFHLKVDWPDGNTTRYTFAEPGRYQVKQ